MAIWIIVHPIGENPTNTTHTLPTPVHVRPAYSSCRWSSYVATFHESSTGLDGCIAPDSTSQPGWVVCGTHLSFSPNTAIEEVCLTQAPVGGRLLGLPGTYLPVCDRYVQYLLTGTNPSILNRRRRGLPYRKPQNSHSALPAFPFWGFHWSP
jgi:hypothetical protein